MNYIQMVEIEIKVSFLKIHVSSQFQNCDNMTITLILYNNKMVDLIN